MKSKENKTQNLSANLLLKVGAQNSVGDSFFYGESWQILRRFVLCFLFTFSISPLWMIAFNLEVNILQQGLTIFVSYALIYLIIQILGPFIWNIVLNIFEMKPTF